MNRGGWRAVVVRSLRLTLQADPRRALARQILHPAEAGIQDDAALCGALAWFRNPHFFGVILNGLQVVKDLAWDGRDIRHLLSPPRSDGGKQALVCVFQLASKLDRAIGVVDTGNILIGIYPFCFCPRYGARQLGHTVAALKRRRSEFNPVTRGDSRCRRR